jgi:hypothetical protein
MPGLGTRCRACGKEECECDNIATGPWIVIYIGLLAILLSVIYMAGTI